MRSLVWPFQALRPQRLVVFDEAYGQPYRIGCYNPAAGEEE